MEKQTDKQLEDEKLKIMKKYLGDSYDLSSLNNSIIKSEEISYFPQKDVIKMFKLLYNDTSKSFEGLINESFELGLKQRVVGMIKIEDVNKIIDNIETEYPDDDGTPFRISPEQFKRELKDKLKELGEKSN